jgi:anthranilate/para-aminobenzoate synthase component II
MYYCSVAWSAGMLPIELLRFLALLAIERQIDAMLQFVAWREPRELFSALTRTAFVVFGLRFHPKRMRKG